MPPNTYVSPAERIQGLVVGLGIGIAALPKTLVQGVVDLANKLLASSFPGL